MWETEVIIALLGTPATCLCGSEAKHCSRRTYRYLCGQLSQQIMNAMGKKMLPVYCNVPDVHKRSRNRSSLVSNYHCLFLFVGTRPVAPLLLTAVGKYKTHPWKPSRVTVFHGLNWLGVESSPDRVQDQFSQANRAFSERTKKGQEHKTFKEGEGGARF